MHSLCFLKMLSYEKKKVWQWYHVVVHMSTNRDTLLEGSIFFEKCAMTANIFGRCVAAIGLWLRQWCRYRGCWFLKNGRCEATASIFVNFLIFSGFPSPFHWIDSPSNGYFLFTWIRFSNSSWILCIHISLFSPKKTALPFVMNLDNRCKIR